MCLVNTLNGPQKTFCNGQVPIFHIGQVLIKKYELKTRFQLFSTFHLLIKLVLLHTARIAQSVACLALFS